MNFGGKQIIVLSLRTGSTRCTALNPIPPVEAPSAALYADTRF